ncbi:MAG: MFS transporter, partial [Pseudomonadota bacterium]
MADKLGAVVVFGWGLGSLGLAVIHNTLNVLLLPYLIVVVGLNPALAGSLVLATKVYDLATDLPMGWVTDRTRTPWGEHQAAGKRRIEANDDDQIRQQQHVQ